VADDPMPAGPHAAAPTPAPAKPIIVTVDDEPAVLAAVARDLRREYGARYRVLRAESGADALEALKPAKLRGERVALFLVDQRMPRMSGLEFLAEASAMFPDAKRVLLTAYADTEASIRAINETRLDYYLMKPWDPPEERLYPVVSDLLDDWQAAFRPPFQGLRVIGHRWSAPSYQVKEFLARNLVPYRWLDVERDEEAEELLTLAGATPDDLPLVVLADGEALKRPTPVAIAERIGLRTRAEQPFYDLVIVGGGPAGLAAAVYGASEGLRTLLVENEAPGGQAGMSSAIENYLGFPSGLSGGDLARRAVTQARRFGAEILTPVEATGLRLDDPYRFVTLSDGSEVSCHALLVATGVSYQWLDVPGAERLAGAGLYYGSATSEAVESRGSHVFIVGAGNSAGQAAMYLAKYADDVTMLVRGTGLTQSMSQYLIAQIEANDRITVRTRVVVDELHGEARLEAVTLRDLDRDATETVSAGAVFVFIGARPRTDWAADVLERDPRGFLLTGPDVMHGGRPPRGWQLERDPFWLESSVSGVFVAGDVRHRSIKRVASAVGEGSMAVQFIHQHLASL
jgi:thioredoxin reductase (NADPH)